ncbi:Zinc finger with UFM1-specific peptidase domain [Lecanosticta acicola]|uniref:Zinc finger with UFM1-specific peptidase domain n=1 Tax=Lecanosticta acicola TaxID=111012 RepID=A0AAI9E7W7_9PEZI|nr:Zinc finger with UFM1-specific peptidase domain [Lecanosticta acicola]
MVERVTCPFGCGYRCDNEYSAQLHIEEHHTENSPFIARGNYGPATNSGGDGPSKARSAASQESMPDDSWTRCTRPGCGEHVLLSEIDEHLDLHTAAALSEQEAQKAPPLPPRRKRSRSPARPQSSRDLAVRSPRKLEKHHAGSILSLVSGTSTRTRTTVRRLKEPHKTGRLGKNELGPYAFEERMPDDVRRFLMRAARPTYVQRIGADGRLVQKAYVENETVGVVDVLSDLCALDKANAATYLCHPKVRHIRKLNCTGNFCGYWSIQTVLTYVQYIKPRGPQTLPNVIEMQELIEAAWEWGVCSYSRTETGGIKNTRKWIGTQECVAFFSAVGVQNEALCFGGGEEDHAAEELLDYVEAYFMGAIDVAHKHGTSHITQLSPIYFQRRGHSMTIVGLERRVDGSRNLLVFDSSFETSNPMKRLVEGRRAHAMVEDILKPYRRSDSQLSDFKAFEIVFPVESGVS